MYLFRWDLENETVIQSILMIFSSWKNFLVKLEYTRVEQLFQLQKLKIVQEQCHQKSILYKNTNILLENRNVKKQLF